MEMMRLMAILRTHWFAVLACVCAVVAMTLVLNFVLPPKYTATAAILVDVRGVNPVLGVAESNTILARNVLGTHASMVRSEGVARQVVARLDLARDPVFVAAWHEDAEGRGDLTAWIAKRLLKSLDVRPDAEDSNVLDLQFTARDPARAAAIVNAFASAYLATSLGLRSDTSRVSADFFAKQSKALRAQVEEAQGKLSAYQRQHGIVGGDERLDVENASLNELSAQALAARAQRIEAQARNAQATGRGSVSPDVLSSPIVQKLLASVADASARLRVAQGGRLGSNLVKTTEIEEELAQLRADLATETERAVSALKATDKISQQREESAQQGLETQRRRVLSLKTLRDGMTVLERDLDSARKAYDQAQLRQSQTSQEGSSPSPEASMLTIGVAPSDFARPGLPLLVPLAIVLGAVLGILAAVLLEMRRPFIQFPSDLESWGLRVLAEMPRASLPRRHRPALRRAMP